MGEGRPVSVVTDSTAYLPPDLVAQHAIEVVSLCCAFGNTAPFREADLDPGPFYERLSVVDGLPTTSPPEVADFAAVYEPLLAGGGSVVSVHISSGISDTCAAARRAAAELAAAGKGGDRVRVLDCATATVGLGLLAVAAARAAASGSTPDQVADLVRQARMVTRVWFLLDTLEFLKRGGRIGSAAAWIGSTLNVKPILTVESEIRAVERVRSRDRGTERLVEYGRQLNAAEARRFGVVHSCSPDEARALALRLQEVFRRPPEFISEIGPVIGTHVGPGLLGFGGIPSRFLD